MSVGENGDIKTIYNVGKMQNWQKNRSNSISELKGSSGITTSDRSTSSNSIPSNNSTVNNQYMQNIENNSNKSSFSLSDGGYSGKSMSNRAVNAYEEGKKPISKFTKADANEFNNKLIERGINEKLTLKEYKELLEWNSGGEWHHTGPLYQQTSFYDPADILEHTNEEIQKDIDYIISENNREL